jgi:hypothetical protein
MLLQGSFYYGIFDFLLCIFFLLKKDLVCYSLEGVLCLFSSIFFYITNRCLHVCMFACLLVHAFACVTVSTCAHIGLAARSLMRYVTHSSVSAFIGIGIGIGIHRYRYRFYRYLPASASASSLASVSVSIGIGIGIHRYSLVSAFIVIGIHRIARYQAHILLSIFLFLFGDVLHK